MDKIKLLKKPKYILLLLFVLSVAVRFLLGNSYPRTVNCYPDELLYLSAAESIWNHHGVMVYNLPTDFGKIGYPLLIAPAFAFTDMRMRMSAIALINAVMVSLGMFPVYALAKKILKTGKWIWISVLLYLISSSLTYSMTFTSETLFIPLALLLLYLLYVFIAEDLSAKRRLALLAVVIPVWLLAYLTKELAMVFPVAVVAYYLTCLVRDLVRGKKINWKIPAALAAVGLAAVVIYRLANEGTAYYQLGLNLAVVGERFWYLIYGTVFFVAASLIAFFVVPVIFPGIFYGYLDEKSRKLYVFMIYLLVITAAVVSYTIYMYEDYPSLTPRAHIRYVEYLSVPFLMVIFGLQEKIPFKWRYLAKTAAVCVTIIFVFRGFYGWTIDHTSLFYLQLISEDGHQFLWWKILVFTLIMTVLVLVLLALFLRDRKAFTALLLTGAVGISLGNTILSGYIQYKTHTHTAEETAEAEQIRSFVQQHDTEKVLVLSDFRGDEMIDTFLMDCDNVMTTNYHIIWYEDWEQGYTDLRKQVLPTRPEVLMATYEPTDVSYLLVYDTGYVLGEGADKVENFGSCGYSLWKMKDPTRLPRIDVVGR